jgi:hypothetical protein
LVATGREQSRARAIHARPRAHDLV